MRKQIVILFLSVAVLFLSFATVSVVAETQGSIEAVDIENSDMSELGEDELIEEETPALFRLLALIPAEAFSDRYLSYVDVEEVFRQDSTFGWTADIGPTVESDDLSAYLNAFRRQVVAGPPHLTMVFSDYEAIRETSGVNLLSLSRLLEVGIAPERQMWLEGPFDLQAVTSALEAAEYEENKLEDEISYTVWSPHGDLAGGSEKDIKLVDYAFIYGAWREDVCQSW